MYRVFYMLPKQHPVFVAEFEDEQYAQVLVDTGNKLYDDGREFWLEYEEEKPDEHEDGYMKRIAVDDWQFIPYDTRY